ARQQAITGTNHYNAMIAKLDKLDAYRFLVKAEEGIREGHVTGVQTCALPIFPARERGAAHPLPAGARGRGVARRLGIRRARPSEIGRASGREKVVMSVGAVRERIIPPATSPRPFRSFGGWLRSLVSGWFNSWW